MKALNVNDKLDTFGGKSMSVDLPEEVLAQGQVSSENTAMHPSAGPPTQGQGPESPQTNRLPWPVVWRRTAEEPMFPDVGEPPPAPGTAPAWLRGLLCAPHSSAWVPGPDGTLGRHRPG